ncbi:MAG: hypothetical protein NTY74_14810 [Ignavibacteriae bacterium]|nr:hypothetical protein [Ignavibacteriota bacterium]
MPLCKGKTGETNCGQTIYICASCGAKGCIKDANCTHSVSDSNKRCVGCGHTIFIVYRKGWNRSYKESRDK